MVEQSIEQAGENRVSWKAYLVLGIDLVLKSQFIQPLLRQKGREFFEGDHAQLYDNRQLSTTVGSNPVLKC